MNYHDRNVLPYDGHGRFGTPHRNNSITYNSMMTALGLYSDTGESITYFCVLGFFDIKCELKKMQLVQNMTIMKKSIILAQ